MRFVCELQQLQDGQWSAHYESTELGSVDVRASQREEALEKIKGEIQYRLELCPCTGESYQHIDVEVVERSS